jgi:putative RNA 2'-phosphotransferase
MVRLLLKVPDLKVLRFVASSEGMSIMNAQQVTSISKFLSLVLRNDPTSIGIELDRKGWTSVAALIPRVARRFPGFDMEVLEEMVKQDSKQRFSFDEEKGKIRANQGHSVKVDLDYLPVPPPEILFHGTVGKFMEAIAGEGLLRMNRHHVHLSKDAATAAVVGGRRGRAVVLQVKAGEMHREGYIFYVSENGVWLTERVPSRFILFP